MKFEIWGLSGSLTTEREDQMDGATERLWFWLDAIDAACNRFRDDSELSQLNESHGACTAISPILELALAAALHCAEVTDDLVDPTVLPALLALGYDRDFDELAGGEPILEHVALPAMGTSAIHLDLETHTVMLDPPCRLDLGASAKALAADLIADDVADSGGVVVEI
ncbi:MAG TPA: FAD:protein FMN transferase, partial [Acidimicrobiales bacterium]